MVNSKGGFLVEDDKEVGEDDRVKARERERERSRQNAEPRKCHLSLLLKRLLIDDFILQLCFLTRA